MSRDPDAPISVIVPVLNDARFLDRLAARLEEVPYLREVIVVDGGSQDGLSEMVRKWDLILLSSPRGRGIQMNRGAEIAKGDVLWFLHADTLPALSATADILETLRRTEILGGAFRFRLAERRWYGPLFEFFIAIRSKIFSLPYGDQGFFVRREIFQKIGGYAEIPLMEDVEFMAQVRGEGQFQMLSTPIEISPRRWDSEGVLKRTALNWWIVLSYKAGKPAEKLIRLYAPSENDSDWKGE
jgi:rSAM/selenodomain-associated transferase 2